MLVQVHPGTLLAEEKASYLGVTIGTENWFCAPMWLACGAPRRLGKRCPAHAGQWPEAAAVAVGEPPSPRTNPAVPTGGRVRRDWNSWGRDASQDVGSWLLEGSVTPARPTLA